jgi:hypothetical protein
MRLTRLTILAICAFFAVKVDEFLQDAANGLSAVEMTRSASQLSFRVSVRIVDRQHQLIVSLIGPE